MLRLLYPIGCFLWTHAHPLHLGKTLCLVAVGPPRPLSVYSPFMRHLTFACCILFAIPLLAAQAAEPAMPLLADSCRFGEPASTQAHGFSSTGAVRSEHIETEMGGLKRSYAVQTVQGTGSGVSFTLAGPRHPGPAILEIQEIHQRRPQAFGYTVSVNGQPVYFRTYEELGAGPNHYFVRIPDALHRPGEALRVELTSAGAPPFSLGQVWLYNDFFGWVDSQEKIYRPMAITSMVATTKLDEAPPALVLAAGRFRSAQFCPSPHRAVTGHDSPLP